MIVNKSIEEIKHLIYAIEIRDAYTQGHSEHVAVYAKEFASFLGLDKKKCEELYIAGLLHDIGKIGIPDNILLKPGRLEKDEFDIIKLHSVISGKIVKMLPEYSHLAEIVKHHHENYDGSGYPDGLKGEEIPFGARVLSLADVFDALTTGRVYRAPLSLEEALSIMDSMQKHNKFDPNLYPKFIEFVKKFGIYNRGKEKNVEFKELEEKRNIFFYIDDLTKLLNRDALIAYLRKCHDYGFFVSLIICNIRGFKLYNKYYGVKKGDELLKKIADMLVTNFNAYIIMKEPEHKDVYVFRGSADKFVVLSVGARAEYINYKVEKIKNLLKERENMEIECNFLLKNKKPQKNIEDEIGYLL
jgi:diguanylate cyclase (GGDEF)-like protein